MVLKQYVFNWEMVQIEMINTISDFVRSSFKITRDQGDIGMDLKRFILRGYRNPCFERLTGMRGI